MADKRKFRIHMSPERREFYAMVLQQKVDDFPWESNVRLTILRLGRPDEKSNVSLTKQDIDSLLEVAEDTAKGYGYAQPELEEYYRTPMAKHPWRGFVDEHVYPLGQLSNFKEPAREILKDRRLRRDLVTKKPLGEFVLGAVLDSPPYSAYSKQRLESAVKKEAEAYAHKALTAKACRLLKKLQKSGTSGKAYDEMTPEEKDMVHRFQMKKGIET